MDKIEVRTQEVIEYTRRVPEHEIYLSFNNDEDAEDFYYWFYVEEIGLKLFEKWVEENRGD